MQTNRGSPTPLGPTQIDGGVNFSLFSQKAQKITLGIFTEASTEEIPLDPKVNRTDSVWHIHIKNLPPECDYAYRIDGSQWTVDPFAKSLTTGHEWGKKPPFLRGRLISDNFDWGDDVPPNIAENKLIIYEMHVRGFAKTYPGLIEKIPYLKDLGINAIELLPVFEFDETLRNYWGYNTQNFFAPMKRYATSSKWGAEITEFKQMVKALHKAGIEVILDVVFNHTDAFKQIDEDVYYLKDANGLWLNFSGCGNTVNCNHPVTIQFILSVLRYWTKEMHVDGFRFDLASIFCRGEDGAPLENPPIIDAIIQDPILAQTKLVAEPWDCAGLYQVGSFPRKRFAEWNGQFRDETRRFLKGGYSGNFAKVLTGSHDLYGHKGSPTKSINFITAHDGFTLRDLVTYKEKHNEANNEENRDGNDYNDSWNCGIEGATEAPQINSLRERQMRNFILALFLSQGTPMLLMGDEYGHTRKGNNNPYCQDNELNYFLWDKLKTPFIDFVKKAIALRKTIPLLTSEEFWSDQEITWHGPDSGPPNWEEHPQSLCFSLGNTLYVAFNADHQSLSVHPPKSIQWHRLIDTSLEPPQDFISVENYNLAPYSALVLIPNSHTVI